MDCTAAVITQLDGELELWRFPIPELAPGDRVISSYAHCGHCYYCRVARQTTLCEQNTVYGAWHPDKLLGGCAEYQIFPAGTSLVRVPETVPPELAASAACALRTVMHAFEHAGAIAAHESVLVLGSGPLGLYATAVARDRGAARVYTMGAPPAALESLRACGDDRRTARNGRIP